MISLSELHPKEIIQKRKIILCKTTEALIKKEISRNHTNWPSKRMVEQTRIHKFNEIKSYDFKWQFCD